MIELSIWVIRACANFIRGNHTSGGYWLSASESMSPPCWLVRVPISAPVWPAYCLPVGSFLDCSTYKQDFVLQLIWSLIWIVSPVLWIVTSLTTSLGLSVRWGHALHWFLPVPLLHLDTPLLFSLSPCLVFTGLALGSLAFTSICFRLVPFLNVGFGGFLKRAICNPKFWLFEQRNTMCNPKLQLSEH